MKGWVNWRKHPAREIILNDLNHGGWVFEEIEKLKVGEELNLALIFALYNHRKPEIFNEIDFEQFRVRMKDYLKKNRERRQRSKQEFDWMQEQKLLFPRSLQNHRGEIVFDLHPAKKMLRQDVRNGRHTELTPSQLQDSRTVYQAFDRKIFRHRIYQEIRFQKYCNWLEDKRNKKEREFKLKKEEEAKKKREKKKKESKTRRTTQSKQKSVKKKKKTSGSL